MSKYEKHILKKLYFCELCCPKKEVEKILNNIDDFYYEKKEDKKDKNGKVRIDQAGKIKKRIITPSTGKLKAIQKNIKVNILSKIKLPEYIQGGVKKKNNISNARQHLGKKYKFTTDIKDFFPFINNRNVFKMFCRYYHPTAARVLTKLTTYRGQLPQGARTSTYIANLVFLDVDNIFIKYCNDNNIKFTIFVDDLTFSSPFDFKKKIPEIIKIINDAGYKINNKKTYYRNRLEITGVMTDNNKLDVPKRIKEKVNINEFKSNKGRKALQDYINRVKNNN